MKGVVFTQGRDDRRPRAMRRRHLLSLINDILDLSKVEAGRLELELADFDLPSAIENALILVRERVARRSLALDRRAAEVGAGGRTEGQEVLVRAGLQDELAENSVSDTGIGIAPVDEEAVFEELGASAPFGCPRQPNRKRRLARDRVEHLVAPRPPQR